jgi:hypothetical protein
MNQLNQTGALKQNVLQDLHDYIYQWTESIPNGGIKVDISDALVTIYDSYQKQVAAEKERLAKEREAESIDEYLDDDEVNYDDDSIYDNDSIYGDDQYYDS